MVAARIGRAWNLYKPNQITYLDTLEGRPLWVNRMGLVAYYPTMALAAVGVVALRRRRVPVYPLLVPLGIVTFAVAITFGQTRYRATAEGPIAVAAALGALQVGDVARRRMAERAGRPVRPERRDQGAPPPLPPGPGPAAVWAVLCRTPDRRRPNRRARGGDLASPPAAWPGHPEQASPPSMS